MQALFLPDAPGRAGKRSPQCFDNFLLGELLSELVENEGPGIKPREQSLCLGCSVLGRTPHPFDSDEKVLAVKFKRKKK